MKPDILSAVIGADSFFYGLFSSNNDLLECAHYKVDSFSDSELIDKIKSDIYSTKGMKIKVAYSGKPYLHNDRANGESLIKFFPSFANKDTDLDNLTDEEVVVDYGMTKQHTNFLNEILGEGSTNFHLSTVLANFYYPYSSEKLVAIVDGSKLHVLFAKDRKFLYYNQFECTHENDFLYFISMVYKEMGLNTEHTVLELAGKIDSDSPIYKLLGGYVRNVQFMRSSILDVKDLRYKAKQHYYLDLFATSICV